MKSISFFITLGVLSTVHFVQAQNQTDSVKLNMPGTFGLLLEGNIPGALKLLNAETKEPVVKKHAAIRSELNRRFNQETDQSSYLITHQSAIDSLLLIYHTYWRKSMIGYPVVYDTFLTESVTSFLNHHYGNSNTSSDRESIEQKLKTYVESKGYHTSGFGRTGKYLDLLVWRKQKDTVYQFTVNNEKINCPVVFMHDFVTLGWEEYATADKLHPGGWATDKSLFCVRKAYDLKSESFNVSYLAHEGRHFNDYKLFPGLTSANLEYRAKLTEMSLLDKEIWNVLTFFINNSNASTTDDHQLANYYLIRDLSRTLFKVDFEKSLDVWKKIPVQKIHEASIALLTSNSGYLKKHKEGYIK